LLADRVSRRFGSAAVLRYGAATGAVGLTVVAFSPWIWTALAGWAIFGLGLSGCVPQLFSGLHRLGADGDRREHVRDVRDAQLAQPDRPRCEMR
jgi:MFS family permease